MYTEHPPCRLLAPYIDAYWEFAGMPGPGMRMHVVPDGCTDFIFTLSHATEAVGDSLVMQPYRAYFVGPMPTYTELTVRSGPVHMLGIRFLPGGLGRFLELPLEALTGKRLHASDLDTDFDDSLAEELASQPDFRRRVVRIERALFRLLAAGNPAADARVAYAVRLIDRHRGLLPVRTVAEESCLCPRQLERMFKRHTGFTPKHYSRIVKFRHAVDLLRSVPFDNLSAVAEQAGYYDLSHFSRELRTLAGSTAGSFLSLPSESGAALLYLEK